MKNTKNSIRLTESQLHRVIKESVYRILNETDWKTYASAARKTKGEERSKDFSDAALRAFRKKYPNVVNQKERDFDPIMVDGEMGYKAKHSGNVIGLPNTYQISDERYGQNGGFGYHAVGYDKEGNELYNTREGEYPFTPDEQNAVDDIDMMYHIGDNGYTKGKGWNF